MILIFIKIWWRQTENIMLITCVSIIFSLNLLCNKLSYKKANVKRFNLQVDIKMAEIRRPIFAILLLVATFLLFTQLWLAFCRRFAGYRNYFFFNYSNFTKKEADQISESLKSLMRQIKDDQLWISFSLCPYTSKKFSRSKVSFFLEMFY